MSLPAIPTYPPGPIQIPEPSSSRDQPVLSIIETLIDKNTNIIQPQWTLQRPGQWWDELLVNADGTRLYVRNKLHFRWIRLKRRLILIHRGETKKDPIAAYLKHHAMHEDEIYFCGPDEGTQSRVALISLSDGGFDIPGLGGRRFGWRTSDDKRPGRGKIKNPGYILKEFGQPSYVVGFFQERSKKQGVPLPTFRWFMPLTPDQELVVILAMLIGRLAIQKQASAQANRYVL